jgi:hypothetical protein
MLWISLKDGLDKREEIYGFHGVLGSHPKAAIRGHLKTGQSD